MENSHSENNGATALQAKSEKSGDNVMDFEELGNASPAPPSLSNVGNIVKLFQTGDVRKLRSSTSSEDHAEVKNNVAQPSMTGEGVTSKSECKEASEEEFYYISEDELEEAMKSKKHLPTDYTKKPTFPSAYSGSIHQRPANLAQSSSGVSSTPGKSYASALSPNSISNANDAGPSSIQRRHSHHSLKELSEIGRFTQIDLKSDEGKLISLYAKNSMSTGSSTNLTVRVQNIYRREKEQSKFESVKKRLSSLEPGSSKDRFKMLLWCKTTPESIKKLAQSRNSCMAFYDRLCRALPLPAHKIKETLHQRILLCKVDLGQMHKSPFGYTRWSSETCAPYGFDSVKGTGKFRPDWHQNQELKKGVIIPCGETEKDNRFQKFELEFNEYLIFESKQIQVQFAVDIEVRRK